MLFCLPYNMQINFFAQINGCQTAMPCLNVTITMGGGSKGHLLPSGQVKSLSDMLGDTTF